jgi:ferric-dicitrate binding protein FerR (iron transport regulator)
MSKSDDYLWDRGNPVDPDVARLEELLAPLAHRAPLDELRVRRRRSRGPWIAAGIAIVLAAAAVALAVSPRANDAAQTATCGAQAKGFAFTARGGTVACAGSEVPGGVLPVGAVLDTGVHHAELAIADIGSATLGANTRVRLELTSTDRHQLHLERGRMHARVSAPPRIFAVTTPSVQVTDLGCEYTIEVDETGAGSIEVQSGKVELESAPGAVIVVPAGARARLLPGRRASLPIGLDASPALVAAVTAFESGTADGFARVLAAATAADALTVVNLSVIVPASQRRAVLERLMELFPAAPGITVEAALTEKAAFDAWLDDIVLAHELRGFTSP